MNELDLDAMDLACGMMIGSEPECEGFAIPFQNEHPLTAIEAIVLKGLQCPPCLVSFSGGRDSSALLAVAVELSRREGLAPPIPITARFTAEETHEEEWQDLVISHLEVSDWIKVDIGDELDLLGPAGTGFLLRHGLRYPQNTHFLDPLFREAAGGSLVTGTGGDELFETHRWGRAAMVISRTVPVQSSDLLVLGAAFSPRPIRARLHHRGDDIIPEWMLPAGRRSLLRRFHKWLGADRVAYDQHLKWWSQSRYLRHGRQSFDLLASDHHVQLLAPFCNDRVIAALAADRDGVGFLTRTDAMKTLFGDLLPSMATERRTKATFLSPLVGPKTREYAIRADPLDLVRTDWVSTSALQTAWQRKEVDVRSLPALQMCWLAEHRPSVSTSANQFGP